MTRLDRYIMKELFVPFLIGTVAFVIMFQANTLIALLKEFNTESIPPMAIAQIILFKTPEFLKFTLPIGVALSTALALSRIVRESELTALRSFGCPIRRVLIPILVLGLVTSIVSFTVSERFQPEAEKRFKKVLREAALIGATPNVANNVMLKLGNRGYIYVRSAQRKNSGIEIKGVMWVEDQGDNRMRIATAEGGTYDRGVWVFPNMLWREFEGQVMINMFAERTVVDEKIEIADLLFGSTQAPEMTLQELAQAIERGKLTNSNVTQLETAYHVRFSLPAACFCFALTGPILAVWFGKNGGFAGVFISMLLVIVYLNVYVVSTEIFGKNGWFSPVMAAWFPNVFFLMIGLWGVRRLE